MENKITTHIIKGSLITLILIAFGLILYFTNQIQNQGLASIQYAILLIGIIWSCVVYSNQMKANVTYGNLFAHGFKTTAVVIVLTIIYTIISIKFLFPDIVDQSMEISRQKMEASGKLSDSQIDGQLQMVKDHFLLFAIAAIIIVFAIVGAISSLIGAAIAKKNPQDPFGNKSI